MPHIRSRARHAAQEIVRRRGWELNPFPNPAALTGQLHRALRKLGVSLVVDVGAFEGQYVSDLRGDVQYYGQIVSFEPNPSALSVVQARAAVDPAWRVEPFALGEEPGVAILNVYDNGPLTSLRSRSHWADENWNFGDARPVEVAVRRLEDLLPGLRTEFPGPMLLKVDAQGHDLSVLRGAGTELPGIDLVQLEVPVQPLYENVPAFAEFMTQVRDLGFEPIAFAPVTTEDAGHHSTDELRVIEFDCLFRRAPSAG